jgi:hypothetical protein
MLQRVLLAVFALAICVGISLSEEIRASIRKIEDGKVTFNASTKTDKVDDKTLPVADKVKVVNGKYNEETKKVDAGDPIEGGLKASVFQKIGDKGLRATIITDSDNKKIVEIRVGGKKK